ncbi:protease inhibitor I42 family protein [Streptomyces triticirhizae]|uniref:protease inhibitor I42 family protein n=1 Tax=Streptomyces triticirhizae TaxID=2483353 RepID=UPI0013153704|nr:protease inhibitor I42 family protein [Streptomyces triticirhizae]
MNGGNGVAGGTTRGRGARARRLLLAPLAALALLLTGTACQDDEPEQPRFTDADAGAPVEVTAGESFLLALEENPSIGWEWTVIDPEPDEAVVRADGDRYESDGDEPGTGGTRLLRFEAVAAGETEITVTRLFRGEYEPETDLVFDIRVVDAG